ncbi:MAG: YbaK/EbsC family protein [Finegoldia sp.]|nr:YbaK/EbsC family protein [Finegoldia sp.]
MSLEKVRQELKKYGLEERVLVFEQSSATADLAADLVGVSPGQIAKSLAFDVDGRTVMILVSGDRKIANPKYKEKFGQKPKMLRVDEVEERTGHPVGGVCPFAVEDGVEIYLDSSLKRYDVVYPACGSANSSIGLRIGELEKYTNYREWVDLSKES